MGEYDQISYKEWAKAQDEMGHPRERWLAASRCAIGEHEEEGSWWMLYETQGEVKSSGAVKMNRCKHCRCVYV